MIIERLTLYHFPMTRSARVKWLLHELLGEAFEVVPVSLYGGEQYTDSFTARNPNHAVPVLEFALEGGETFTMIESGAIVSLLADVYADRGLAPPPAPFSRQRADYLQMLHFSASWFDMMLWQLRLHHDLFPADVRDERTIGRFRKKIKQEVEPQLLARLGRGDYICGDAFSAADCIMGHDVIWARMYGLCEHETFGAYLARLEERPAWQAAFADRHEFSAKPT